MSFEGLFNPTRDSVFSWRSVCGHSTDLSKVLCLSLQDDLVLCDFLDFLFHRAGAGDLFFLSLVYFGPLRFSHLFSRLQPDNK